MDESKEWGLDMAHLREEIKSARARGVLPKALVVINPGNPVGNCLSWDDLTELVKFCRAEKLVLLAVEVYQENVYSDRPFHSVKKVGPARPQTHTRGPAPCNARALAAEQGLAGHSR